MGSFWWLNYLIMIHTPLNITFLSVYRSSPLYGMLYPTLMLYKNTDDLLPTQITISHPTVSTVGKVYLGLLWLSRLWVPFQLPLVTCLMINPKLQTDLCVRVWICVRVQKVDCGSCVLWVVCVTRKALLKFSTFTFCTKVV